MPKPSWENLDDFLELDDTGGFAHRAVIERATGGNLTVTGIFDEPYMSADAGEYMMDTIQPRFMAKETDFPGVRRGDVFYLVDADGAQVGERLAVMTYPQGDGTGMATLALSSEPNG